MADSAKLKELLGRMAKQSASGGGIWMRDGVYDKLIVKHIEYKETFEHGLSFIAELYVAASRNDPQAKTGKPNKPEIYSPEGSQVEANPAGSTLTFFQGDLDSKREDYFKMAFGNVKQFMLTLAGEPDFPETDEEAAKAFVNNCLIAAGPDQPLTGAAIKATTRRKWTKTSGNLLVLPVWETLPNTPDDVEANKKLLAGIPAAA